MKKTKWKINVDKLKICYNQPAELWQYLSKFNNDDIINYDCFQIHIIDDGRGKDNNDKPRVKIKANVVTDEGILLGKFEFNNSSKYEGKCFFTFDNKALYTTAGHYMGNKYNHLITLDFIEQQLGIEKNNITTVEVALDVNFNVIHKIQLLIKDYKNYTMYVNGNIITDAHRKIENYGEYFQRSRKRRERYPTIYLTQSREDSPRLKIYNKTNEIKESGKDYINEWNEISGNVYRTEITVKNEDYKKFMEIIGQQNDIYTQIEGVCLHFSTKEYICSLWQYITDRMLYFRNNSTNEVIRMLDICTNTTTPKVYNQYPFEVA